MGLIGNLIAGAQQAHEERREQARAEAEAKSAQQDEGWACQLRIKLEFSKSHARTWDMHVKDRTGNLIYKVEPGLMSPKRRTIIKDAAGKEKIAVLKAVRFKGIGVEAALDVTVGDVAIGRVLKRKAGMMNGYDRTYHFEPVGLHLDIEGKILDAHYEIKDSTNKIVAIVYRCSKFEDDSYKINFNDMNYGLYYLAMWIAKGEIDDKPWEDD